MVDHVEQHTFTGTPDQWWDQAEPITEEEAADRHLGTWYILAESRDGVPTDSYRISRPTQASNEARKAALRRRIDFGSRRPEDTAKNLRALVRVHVEQPAWIVADLVIANASSDDGTRVPWRRARSGRWTQVFGGITISEQTLRELNPVPASITEG